MYQTWVPQVSILRPGKRRSLSANSSGNDLGWETANLLVPRPHGFVSLPTDSGAAGLDFETWEITNPRGHRTSGLPPFLVRPLPFRKELNQNERRALTWTSRPGVATSVMLPKLAVLTKRLGVPRLVWLNALKNSPRISKRAFSAMMNSRTIPRSMVSSPGPYTVFRPTFPYV